MPMPLTSVRRLQFLNKASSSVNSKKDEFTLTHHPSSYLFGLAAESLVVILKMTASTLLWLTAHSLF